MGAVAAACERISFFSRVIVSTSEDPSILMKRERKVVVEPEFNRIGETPIQHLYDPLL